MRYAKPILSITAQIALLQSRGLVIADPDKAEEYLANVSYYRLSGYMYPFKNLATGRFINNIAFEEIIELYLFDRELRLLIFDAIEIIEVSFRTQLIYHPSMRGGAFWFKDASNFEDAARLDDHLRQLNEEVGRSSAEVFINHFFNKYVDENTPPAWMTFEVLSLGLLSRFYQNLRKSSKAKKDIANHFGVSHPIVFQSWIRSITYVRNICAHHSRLWNRVLTNRPAIPHTRPGLWLSLPEPGNDKIYYLLCCVRHMLREAQPKTTFVDRLKGLFKNYPQVSKAAMGFPHNWETQPFWQ